MDRPIAAARGGPSEGGDTDHGQFRCTTDDIEHAPYNGSLQSVIKRAVIYHRSVNVYARSAFGLAALAIPRPDADKSRTLAGLIDCHMDPTYCSTGDVMLQLYMVSNASIERAL